MKKIYLVTDQVGGWANRVMSKLNNQILGQDIHPSVKKQPLLSLFAQISDITCSQLEEIVQKNLSEQDGDTGFITSKDFMNDFATEEFITKNIRVRPPSGFTTKDFEDRQSEHISKNNMILGGENDNDEEKFNKMVNLDMEDQRKKIKVQKDEFERRKIIDLERKERAASKKNK